MSCLALSLQPSNGSDILLQTREWFPPARALAALTAFRHTRLAFAAAKTAQSSSVDSIGDDPLAASSGQLIVGVESRYRVVYRLVNSIYVLGVTTADHDNSINVFECIHVVNQAVSVVVAACRGVDVTPEKLGRKYAEVYMALDIVLKGVSNIRLAAMLGSMHGESIAKMVHSAADTENKVRGAESWIANAEGNSVEHLACVEVFSNAGFELPAETIAAGDEVAAAMAPPASSGDGESSSATAEKEEKIEEIEAEKDPFAASDKLNQPAELVGGFKKTRDPSATDLTTALATLEVTTLPPAEATQSTRIAVEGFEGEYGGIEFGGEKATLGETFEGFSDAWGGGLDASEFVGPEKALRKQEGLGGLELLHTSEAPKTAAPPTGPENPLDGLVKSAEMRGPEMHIVEQISVEFRDSLLARVGLMGTVYLKTLSGDKETEFSFRVEGTSPVKRFVIHSSRVSSLGDGTFHVRTKNEPEIVPLLKYSLVPRATPLPLRVRLVKRHSGSLLSVMIQYAANPELSTPLSDVSFVLKLPVDPTLLKVSPKAQLSRAERELRWHVAEIPAKGAPGKLRARFPVDYVEGEEEVEVVAFVKFSVQTVGSLSGLSLRPATEGKTDFYETLNRYETGVYMCN